MVPSYIVDLLPPLVNEVSGYPLRNNNNVSASFPRTNVSLKNLYTSIYQNVELSKNLPTTTSFKHQLQSTTFPKIQVPSYFAWGNRYLSVLHARLVNNCSNLNNDLFINHLCERPFCSWCNVIEDVKHYFCTEMSALYFPSSKRLPTT